MSKQFEVIEAKCADCGRTLNLNKSKCRCGRLFSAERIYDNIRATVGVRTK